MFKKVIAIMTASTVSSAGAEELAPVLPPQPTSMDAARMEAVMIAITFLNILSSYE